MNQKIMNELWEEFGRRAPKTAFIIHSSMVFSLRGQKESWRRTLHEMEYVTEYFASEITKFNRRLGEAMESGEYSPFNIGMWIGDVRGLLEECSAENDLLLGYFQKLERQIRDALQARQSDLD